MKKKLVELSDEERIKTLDALYTAAGAVHGRDAMKRFLRDLLTPSERVMLGRRILIARLLLLGESERNVGKRLGVGFDTVYRVNRWLEDQMPGYEEALRGLEAEIQNRRDKKLYATSALFRLKKKYPLHFLLFPMPKGSSDIWSDDTPIKNNGRPARTGIKNKNGARRVV